MDAIVEDEIGGETETLTPRKSLLRSASWTDRSPTANRNQKPKPETVRPDPVRPSRRPMRLALPLRPSFAGWPRAASDDSGPNTSRSLADPDPADISRITDHVYLGSDSVARDRDALRRHGITHILNCVGSTCLDYFRGDSTLIYKTLWLHDSPGEDLASILYDAFDFLESALTGGGRALVHCMKGASRSAAVVVAYLMWRHSLPFDAALRRVRTARPAADPNLGFAAQLLRHQHRVNGSPMSPGSIRRILRLAPHSPYAPQHLVPKSVPVLTTGSNPLSFFDSRGAFLVHVPGSIYVWIGKKCEPVMALAAAKTARQVIKYERVSGPVVSVNEGDEDEEFWWAVSEEMIEPDPLEVGKRRVEDYDLDFQIFYHSLKSSNNHTSEESPESCTPSSSSSSSVESNFSPASNSSSDWYSSPSTPERREFCQTPRVHLDPIKETDKDTISPLRISSKIVKEKKSSLAERRGGAAACMNFSEKDGIMMDWCPSPAVIPDLDEEHELNIKRQLSLDSFQEEKEGEFVHPILYRWPEMEKIEEIHPGVLDSFSVFLMLALDSRVGSKRSKLKVLYIWLGRFMKLSAIDDKDVGEGENKRDIYARKIGEEFVCKMALPKNTSFEIIQEGREPEEFLNHLFSFH